MDETRRRWLEAHPFLAPLAHFQGLVEGAVQAIPAPAAALPPWVAHAPEYAAGVPLLRGRGHAPPLQAAGAEVLAALTARVCELPLPAKLLEGCREVRDATAAAGPRQAAVAWLCAEAPEGAAPVQPGLLRFLGWTALQRALAPHLPGFEAWRDDQGWQRPTCPTCGAAPVMAQLVEQAAGRGKLLVCGCCATRWGWRRIGCPYCGNEAAERLAVLELEGPAGLRLDVCESCQGYQKTYTGAGQEALFLADWPTLVLDAMAAERGYLRRGVSLYEL